jgi:cation:H+ antiporter
VAFFVPPPNSVAGELIMIAWLTFLAGLLLLLFGAEVFVRGCVGLALRLSLSRAVVGLTIVALGTSLPELVIGLSDAARGGGDVAVGGMVGSNFFNLGIVLAIAALIRPVPITRRTVVLEYPFTVGAIVVLGALTYLDEGRAFLEGKDGYLLLAFALAFVFVLVLAAARDRRRGLNVLEDLPEGLIGWGRIALFVALGPVLLYFGGKFALEGASEIARQWGMSEYLIGLTVVAFCTSAPELFVSAVAATRGDSAVAAGNVIGSNVFNLTLVLGSTSLLSPIAVEGSVLSFDLPVLTGLTLLVLPLMILRRNIGRLDGLILLVVFAAYYGWKLTQGT